MDSGGSKTRLKAITVRVPEAEYRVLHKYAQQRGDSLNTIVAEAVAQYGAKLEREDVVQDIKAFQARLRDGQAGSTNSTEELRQIRAARSATHASKERPQ